MILYISNNNVNSKLGKLCFTELNTISLDFKINSNHLVKRNKVKIYRMPINNKNQSVLKE
ncbi:hypothetical protein DSECCO2_282280 [anaerobic digester metagenome]|jgi:hypothetical protein